MQGTPWPWKSDIGNLPLSSTSWRDSGRILPLFFPERLRKLRDGCGSLIRSIFHLEVQQPLCICCRPIARIVKAQRLLELSQRLNIQRDHQVECERYPTLVLDSAY